VATLRLAHRGDWRHAPENSLAALLAAVDVPGCDGVEFDVRASRDGVPVLCHDETLRRVHGVDARVDSLRWTELEQIGVVSLEDVLAAIPPRAFLDVELKDDPGRGAVEVLAAGRGPALERAVVSSFRPATLERVAGLAPTWPPTHKPHHPQHPTTPPKKQKPKAPNKDPNPQKTHPQPPKNPNYEK
jgi:glycerophosphoryl diester phosphodiesterase